MPEISQDVVALLRYLLPGFLMASVYYGLTSHVRPSQFERVVQALIFTVVVQAPWDVLRLLSTHMSPGFSARIWTSELDLALKLVTALAAGVVSCSLTNKDIVHTKLRKFGVTHRSAYPGEWSMAFTAARSCVIVYLKDGSVVMGWPRQWPTDPRSGHLHLVRTAWLTRRPRCRQVEIESMLIDVTDVVRVEFVKGEQ